MLEQETVLGQASLRASVVEELRGGDIEVSGPIGEKGENGGWINCLISWFCKVQVENIEKQCE